MIGEVLELRQLLQNRKLSPAELEAVQRRKLRAVIRHAYENVPHYRSLFTSAGLSPEDIRTVEDLKHVPITTKEDLRAAPVERVTAKGVDLSSCRAVGTSGSTGKPFTVYLAPGEVRTRRLIEFRTLVSVGFRPRDRLAVLGPESPHRTRLHQRLGLYRSGNISPFLPVEDQIARLQGIRPTLLWAYPTVLRALLHSVDHRLSKLVRPRALITSGEIFDTATRERLRADLDMEMFDFYGAIEVGRIAWECAAHEGLHVNPDHLIVECVQDEKPAGRGESGVVVVTTLNAFAMPFIRYRLGDICTPIRKHCSCGSPFPLIGRPLGRQENIIGLPSGKVLPSLGFDFILRRLNAIDQYRCIQESRDHLVLKLVFRRDPQEELLIEIRSLCTEYLGEPVRLDIQIVDFLQEETRKLRTFISKLPQWDL